MGVHTKQLNLPDRVVEPEHLLHPRGGRPHPLRTASILTASALTASALTASILTASALFASALTASAPTASAPTASILIPAPIPALAAGWRGARGQGRATSRCLGARGQGECDFGCGRGGMLNLYT